MVEAKRNKTSTTFLVNSEISHHPSLSFFNYCFQGSVVNMNVMGPIYNMFAENFGVNHTTLGWTLFVGESVFNNNLYHVLLRLFL